MRSTYHVRILVGLRRLMHEVDSFSRRMSREYGVTGPQLLALSALVESGASSLTELKKHMNLSVSTVSGIVERLERKGLIVRQRNVVDRRRNDIAATEAGRRLIGQTPDPLPETIAASLSTLSEQEQMALAKALESLPGLSDAVLQETVKRSAREQRFSPTG